MPIFALDPMFVQSGILGNSSLDLAVSSCIEKLQVFLFQGFFFFISL